MLDHRYGHDPRAERLLDQSNLGMNSNQSFLRYRSDEFPVLGVDQSAIHSAPAGQQPDRPERTGATRLRPEPGEHASSEA